MGQASDKSCRLTLQGAQKLEDALKVWYGDRPSSDSQVAKSFSIDRGTVSKIRSHQEAVNRSSIDRLFTPLDLDLLDGDYEPTVQSKKEGSIAYPPNPFVQDELWKRDKLLENIFVELRKGGSQALIGPAGCGKSEILKAIGREGGDRLGRNPESFLHIDMNWIRDEMGFFNELCHLLDFELCDQNQIRRRLKRSHVLCLDEIHVLTNEAFFPISTRNWLRSMAEAEYRLQLVVASQQELRMLFPDDPLRSSPLADFFSGQTMRLEYWSLDEVAGFVRDRLQGTGVEFEVAEIQEIWEGSDGQQKVVRELAGKLYETIVAR